MGRQQSHGRRRVSIADLWNEILDQQLAVTRSQDAAAMQPSQHVGARWCGHAWACDCAPEAGAARPAASDTPREEGATP